MNHLRHAGLPFERQRAILFDIVRAEPLLMAALEGARDMALPQWRIVAGAVYNSVWNALTGRPSGYGIKDIDLLYYDADDLTWEAEDAVIRHGARVFAGSAVPVEIRNQARVHLWFPDKFGIPFPPLTHGDEAITRYSSQTHAVGLRLEADGALDLAAPFGLEPIFAFRIVPNRALDNAGSYGEKAARAKRMWPEVTVEPW